MTPQLTVILATPGDWMVISKTVSHLVQQTLASSIELLVVTPSRTDLNMPQDALNDFAQLRLLETGSFRSIGRANAAGVREASSKIIVLAEDHCFPEPGWAAALLSAHEEDYAAVGPAILNANPATAVSWADLLVGYGPWLAPSYRREVEFLPGHNSSYKRDILLAYGDRLEEMMEAETVLHWDLRSKGARLLLEPEALAAHTNFSLWGSLLRVQFFNGRTFAGSRVRHMSLSRRALYAVGSPLIPAVRLVRIVGQARRGGFFGQFLRCLHALVPALILDGAGQFAGYLLGTGKADKRVAEFEFRRLDHITPADRQRIFGSQA